MGTILLTFVLLMFSNYVFVSSISDTAKTQYGIFLAVVLILWLITRII